MIRTNIGKRGFTLVELLVVVGMIAMITGAISTSMSSAVRRARIQKATAEVKSLTQAILAYENHNSEHELPLLVRKSVDDTVTGFLVGKGGSSAAGTKIPALLQAALSADGVMRDPWGQPYLITIRKGSVTSPSIDSLKTGYYLPNFYRLTSKERGGKEGGK